MVRDNPESVHDVLHSLSAVEAMVSRCAKTDEQCEEAYIFRTESKPLSETLRRAYRQQMKSKEICKVLNVNISELIGKGVTSSTSNGKHIYIISWDDILDTIDHFNNKLKLITNEYTTSKFEISDQSFGLASARREPDRWDRNAVDYQYFIEEQTCQITKAVYQSNALP